MTLRDGATYVAVALALLASVAWLYWVAMYVAGWGVYALSNAITIGIVGLFFYGLAWAIHRRPSEA